MPITVFNLAGYIPNLFEYEPLNVYGSIDMIISEKMEIDWNNLIFHAAPVTPEFWVEYYRQSAINGELLTIDDPVFKDHCKEYHSWADEWDCCCRENDKTEWYYCANNKSSTNCSQCYIEQSMLMQYYTFWQDNDWHLRNGFNSSKNLFRSHMLK
jgi:hypothetical protein